MADDNSKADRPQSLKRAPRRAPDENVDPVDTPSTPKKTASSATGKKRGPYNVKRVKKTAMTVRLTDDVHAIIDRAQELAAADGDRLTNDDVVIEAVRAYWGRKNRRKRSSE